MLNEIYKKMRKNAIKKTILTVSLLREFEITLYTTAVAQFSSLHFSNERLPLKADVICRFSRPSLKIKANFHTITANRCVYCNYFENCD